MDCGSPDVPKPVAELGAELHHFTKLIAGLAEQNMVRVARMQAANHPMGHILSFLASSWVHWPWWSGHRGDTDVN